LQLQQVFQSVWIIGIDRDPLATLSGRVDGIKANGDLSFEMSPDGVSRQRKPAFRPVIVTAASLGIRGGRLDCVGSPVDEQLKITSYGLI
jgi:hypothetical protein